jgi:hypothetical protein
MVYSKTSHYACSVETVSGEGRERRIVNLIGMLERASKHVGEIWRLHERIK